MRIRTVSAHEDQLEPDHGVGKLAIYIAAIVLSVVGLLNQKEVKAYLEDTRARISHVASKYKTLEVEGATSPPPTELPELIINVNDQINQMCVDPEDLYNQASELRGPLFDPQTSNQY